ncbi:MAG TPA: DNA alkylation repair protein [Streptosporangiaceae bacterium]|nr:DNA alkylation repair protein [Streptosporangiaceae bacterium]
MTVHQAEAAQEVAAALRPLGTPERAAQEKRYLKSDLEFWGVSVPDIRRVVTAAVRRHPGLSRDEAVALALELWRQPVHERRTAAVEVLRLQAALLEPADLATIETLIRASGTWALVDPLAGDIAGRIVLRNPAGWRHVDRWADDADFWVRRSALLSLLPGIRAGQPDRERFDRYATAMLGEKEFFIRKAIGWVLRDLSRKDPEYVIAWTERHLAVMSGVTFREAVRRLPAPEAARLTSLRTGAA